MVCFEGVSCLSASQERIFPVGSDDKGIFAIEPVLHHCKGFDYFVWKKISDLK